MIRLDVQGAADAAAADRRGDERRSTPGGFFRGVTENKLGAGILIALVVFAASWFTSVSDAREKVASHAAAISAHAARIEALERNEIRLTEELKYIRLKLTEIAEAVSRDDRRRGR